MTTVIGFTGRGEQIVAEVPIITPRKMLTSDVRAHVLRLIASEHQGVEDEAVTLGRLIVKNQADMEKLRGIHNDQGMYLSDLIAIRLESLYAYRAEITSEDW